MADARANIYPENFEIINGKFGSNQSLTGFVNEIIKKYLDEKILELNPENYLMIKGLSIKMNKTMEEMLNECLAAVHFEVQPIEKPVVQINPQKLKAKNNFRKSNPFTNY